jgi:hypothetical protein
VQGNDDGSPALISGNGWRGQSYIISRRRLELPTRRDTIEKVSRWQASGKDWTCLKAGLG